MDNREKLLKKIRKIWFKNVDEFLTSIEKEEREFWESRKTNREAYQIEKKKYYWKFGIIDWIFSYKTWEKKWKN